MDFKKLREQSLKESEKIAKFLGIKPTTYQKEAIQKFIINKQWTMSQIYHNQLIEELSKLDFQSLLDCGCGNKWLEKELKNKIYEGFDLPADLNGELPYRDQSFDMVICAAVLCTMRNIEKAIENIKRIARKYIILVEFQGNPKDYSTGDGSSVRIMRDYEKDFGLKFKMVDIPKEVWPGNGWDGEAPGKIMIHEL